MSNLAVNIAVIHEGKILLTQREDFETWILPGGGVEDRESLGQAAIRETKEETGLDVELTGLVGIYSRLGNWYPGYLVLFAAKPAGGAIKCQDGETITVKWFAFDELPAPLSMGHQRRIRDVVEGARGLAVLQEIKLPDVSGELTRTELYKLRDRSGLPRQAFYLQMIDNMEINEMVEVGMSDV